MTNNKVSYIILILISLFIGNNTIKGQVEEDRIKAYMLYYICDFITWPAEDSLDKFTIGSLGINSNFTDALKAMAKSREINAKPIVIREVSIEKIHEQLQVLFVSKSYFYEIDLIFEFCKNNNMWRRRSNAYQ